MPSISKAILRIVLVILLSTTIFNGFAEKQLPATREFNQQTLENLRQKKAYRYNVKSPNYQPSFLTKLWWRINSFLNQLFRRGGVVSIIRIFIFITIVLLAAFIIYKMNFSNALRQRNSKETLESLDINEIKEENIDAIILKAVQDQNYAEAIRYTFIKHLKTLDNRGLIQYNKHKSNYDYIFEIKDNHERITFRQLMMIQESVVYGHKESSLEMYNEMQERSIRL